MGSHKIFKIPDYDLKIEDKNKKIQETNCI